MENETFEKIYESYKLEEFINECNMCDKKYIGNWREIFCPKCRKKVEAEEKLMNDPDYKDAYKEVEEFLERSKFL